MTRDRHPDDAFEKRLSPRERQEPEARLRLLAEGELLARLGGRATPKLLARGEDDEGPWLRMERVPFPTLAERLDARAEPLAPAFVEGAAVATLEALDALHEAADAEGPLRVVHADLSPANVAVDDAARRAVLLDLGLSVWRASPPRDGAFRGTVRYVAPEVARGEAPTRRGDLFSLAAVLAHAATGAPPRDGPSLAAMLAAAADAPVAEAVRAALAGALAPLAACLAHDPAARPATAREVLAAIRARW